MSGKIFAPSVLILLWVGKEYRETVALPSGNFWKIQDLFRCVHTCIHMHDCMLLAHVLRAHDSWGWGTFLARELIVCCSGLSVWVLPQFLC